MRPIVILGAPRSGTKFLRDLLGTSSQCTTIPFDLNHVWMRNFASARHDAINCDQYDKKVAHRIQQNLSQLVKRSAKKTATLYIEKTVSNTLRVDFVRKVLPEAKIIHLVRDGHDVVESAYRCWHERPAIRYLSRKLKYFTIHDAKYLTQFAGNVFSGVYSGRGVRMWGPKYPGHETDLKQCELHIVCARQWRWCASMAHQALQTVDSDTCLAVRYETLVRDRQELKRINEFLDLPDGEIVLEHYDRNICHTTGGRWTKTFTSKQRSEILAEINPTLMQLGYRTDAIQNAA